MTASFSIVKVDRSAEAGYRRRALKAYPVEYMELLWGFIDDGIAHVCVFMPLPHKATERYVSYEPRDVGEQKVEARKYELEVIGSVHSHPDRDDALFSEGDLRDVQSTKEAVMAICAIEKKESKGKTRRVCRIAYWPGVRPLQVEYTDWNKDQR